MKRRWAWSIAGVVVLAAAVALAFELVRTAEERMPPGVASVGEQLERLKAERAALQARADGPARLELLGPLRVASLLSDGLAVRAESAGERSPDRLPLPWRDGFAALGDLNIALRDALARPGAGATLAAGEAAKRGEAALAQLAAGNDLPLVLSFTPRFVPPRRTTGEITLAPHATTMSPQDSPLRIGAPSVVRSEEATAPTVPRYAPDFAAQGEKDSPVVVEIAGLRLFAHGNPPTLTIGAWRGEGEIRPERLRFVVPRAAFATQVARTTLVTATLALRRDGRTAIFELPLLVLPDRPGSMALDQKVRGTTTESRTLVSPEILARAGAGESRTVHRCFDPPEGWRFDEGSRRVVVVERLAWIDDISDQTMNAGSVEFASADKPGQICVNVVAKPAAKTARTATIGRFEATLLHDKEEDRTVPSGVRALDWREPIRVPLEDGVVAWKLYVRLFDEIDREFSGARDAGKLSDMPFLHIALENDGKTMLLTADPRAEP